MTREEWDMMLEAPLPGRAKKPSPLQLEAEEKAFMDAMSQFGGE